MHIAVPMPIKKFRALLYQNKKKMPQKLWGEYFYFGKNNICMYILIYVYANTMKTNNNSRETGDFLYCTRTIKYIDEIKTKCKPVLFVLIS